jgi:hypothetical protein
MVTPEQVDEALRSVDWRHRVIAVLAEDLPAAGPGAPEHKAGTPVIMSTALTHHDEVKFFDMPNVSGLLMGVANTAYEHWRRDNPLLSGADLSDTRPVFDSIGNGMTAVLTGYSAVEAFVNDEIPEDAVYPRKTRKGKVDKLAHDRIIRELSLNEKLTSVLPQLKLPDASQHEAWAPFTRIRELRHRIVHAKKADVTHYDGRGPTPDTIWSQVLDPSLPNPAKVAKDLISHISGSNPPHWIKYCPF